MARKIRPVAAFNPISLVVIVVEAFKYVGLDLNDDSLPKSYSKCYLKWSRFRARARKKRKRKSHHDFSRSPSFLSLIAYFLILVRRFASFYLSFSRAADT